MIYCYVLFLRINVTEKNFCYMGNQTHNFGTNRLTLPGLYTKGYEKEVAVALPSYDMEYEHVPLYTIRD